VNVYGATRMTGLGRTTILGLAGAGELPRLRIGRAVPYAVVGVEHLIDRMRAGEQLLMRAKDTSVPARY
jgi:hypothetical protein